MAQGVDVFNRPGTESQPVRIGSVIIDAWVEGQADAGQMAPTKRTESGYKTSYAGIEPQTITVRAKLEADTVIALDNIRRTPETVTVSVGPWLLSECAIDSLTPVTSGDTPGAFETTIQLREVQIAEAGTARIYLPSSASGSHAGSSGADSGGGGGSSGSGGGGGGGSGSGGEGSSPNQCSVDQGDASDYRDGAPPPDPGSVGP